MHIGWYAGMSLIQGGPGFPLLPDAVYEYLCTGETTDMTVADEDLPLMIKELVQQVNSTILIIVLGSRAVYLVLIIFHSNLVGKMKAKCVCNMLLKNY